MKNQSFKIERCTMSDYSQITKDIVDFWGSDRTLSIHHPILIYEFGNTAYVVRDKEKVIAYLFGFFSQTESCAYVHLTAVREQYQKKGLGESMYKYFIDVAKSMNIKKLKAITSPGNGKSISFHKNKIGMSLLGEPNAQGLNIVRGYSGENKDVVVFEMTL